MAMVLVMLMPILLLSITPTLTTLDILVLDSQELSMVSARGLLMLTMVMVMLMLLLCITPTLTGLEFLLLDSPVLYMEHVVRDQLMLMHTMDMLPMLSLA